MGCFFGCSSSYVPEGTSFAPTNCTTTYSLCNLTNHQIIIHCKSHKTITFHDTIAIESLLHIPESIIPNNTNITNVQLHTKFQHTYVGDLQSYLWHENETISLFGDPNSSGGNCNADNVDVIISDSSSNSPFTGNTCDSPIGIGNNHKPVNNLSVYNGLNANGDWYFYVYDKQSQDFGYFGEWSIILDLDPTFCTLSPTNYPSTAPSTSNPTIQPTYIPTLVPSITPSKYPTYSPSNIPTTNPTYSPSNMPTLGPINLISTSTIVHNGGEVIESTYIHDMTTEINDFEKGNLSIETLIHNEMYLGILIVGMAFLCVLLCVIIYALYQRGKRMDTVTRNTSLKTADSLVNNSKIQTEMIEVKPVETGKSVHVVNMGVTKGEAETFYTPPLTAQNINNGIEIETTTKMMTGMKSNTSNDSMYDNMNENVVHVGITPYDGKNNDEIKPVAKLMSMSSNDSLYNSMNEQVTTKGNETIQ